MSTMWVFDHIEIRHNLYHGKDCIKRFSSSLREHARNKFNFEKKKMILLTKYKMPEIVTFVEKQHYKSSLKIKIIEKLEIIAIIQVNIETQHIVFVI